LEERYKKLEMFSQHEWEILMRKALQNELPEADFSMAGADAEKS